jgi:colanic acid biosynthesis protein WcaH
MDATIVDDASLSQVIRHTPLVAIDLIAREPEGKVLVCLRTNEPARGFYFVPGGRIRKNERLETAFQRILLKETGVAGTLAQAHFMGVFEHFYPTNRFTEPGYGTHYVVLAYEVPFSQMPSIVLDDQHSAYRWMLTSELVAAKDVHPYSKAYFWVPAQ